ncbi:MAG: glycosyltransferase family 2 protein [Crocinitomicaceae bacterium]
MDKNSFVSIIIPCRNEEAFIYKVLENIKEQDYSNDNLEILLADGMSNDDTISEINRFIEDNADMDITILKNEMKVVPHGLNDCLKRVKGDVIVRMDAHSVYPKNYVSRLVEVLNKKPDAWNVGGYWDTQPGDETSQAQAIVHATSHKAGIGNAQYRLKGNKILKVDTVPFGCFPKKVFDEIGNFDEDLIRNQDDEFNARIIQNGGKIYLIPDLKIKYFARPTFSKMVKMFFQYGYFKPLVNKKLGSAATLRQFAPPILVLCIALGWLPALLWPAFIFIYIGGIALYLALLLIIALTIKTNFKVKLLSFIAFVIIHFSYGWGYLRGLIDFMLLSKERNKTIIDTSR